MLVASRVALVFVLLLPVRGLAAPDCDGGTVGRLHVVGDRLRFQGTVTRRGAAHAAFVGNGSFHFQIIDTVQDAEVYAADVPGDRFVTRGRVTAYDHRDTFTGGVM